MGVIKCKLGDNKTITLDNIARQLEIVYHIDVAISSLESIGLLMEGESTKPCGTDKHIGNNMYAAMSSAIDTITVLLLNTNTEEPIEENIKENIDNSVHDIIIEMRKSDEDRRTLIPKLYDLYLKEYERGV